MPFSQVSVVESRLAFVDSVLVEGLGMLEACRRHGIARTTGYKWLERHFSGDGLEDRSRRPSNSPGRVPAEVEEEVLALKARYPAWGAKKLAVLLGGRSPSVRTLDRILARHGLTSGRPRFRTVGSFEMERCNMLWQLDHKGVPRGNPPLFGCVDDASRFCLALAAVRDQSLEELWGPLWDAFGEYGLPEAILSDNGVAFKNLGMRRRSSFELRLMLLGIKPLHGRPYHPQTQGKIERFFGTLAREAPSCILAFRDAYNNVRPHEALGMRTPAQRYRPSDRRRPSEMPPVVLDEGCEKRRTTNLGVFTYKGRRYRVGRAVGETTIGIKDGHVFYGPVSIGSLQSYEV